MIEWQDDAAFVAAVTHTLEREGVFSDVAEDAGGATIFGIASEFHPEVFDEVCHLWKLSKACADPIRAKFHFNSAVKRAKRFYFDHFWMRLRCNEIHNKWVAMELFDTGVNSEFMMGWCAQQTVNLFRWCDGKPEINVDGVMGPITRAAVNAIIREYPSQFMGWYNHFQGLYYRTKSYEANPDRRKRFLKGWGLRLLPPLLPNGESA